MRLTVKHILDATPVVAQIINERRPMCQKGKYRLARLHAKLLPEYTAAMARRDAMIKAYDAPLSEGVFQVPEEKLPEFNDIWGRALAEDVEVSVEPIPVDLLDLGNTVNGSVEAYEIALLGSLVA